MSTAIELRAWESGNFQLGMIWDETDSMNYEIAMAFIILWNLGNTGMI